MFQTRAFLLIQDQFLGTLSFLYNIINNVKVKDIHIRKDLIEYNNDFVANDNFIEIDYALCKALIKDVFGYNAIDRSTLNNEELEFIDDAYNRLVFSYINLASTPLMKLTIKIPLKPEDVQYVESRLVNPLVRFKRKFNKEYTFTNDIWKHKLNFAYYIVKRNNNYMNKYIRHLIPDTITKPVLVYYFFNYNFNMYFLPYDYDNWFKYALKAITMLETGNTRDVAKLFKLMQEFPVDILAFVLINFITRSSPRGTLQVKELRKQATKIYDQFLVKFFNNRFMIF